jgi:nucleobase:cation symporter-1, NCS1 family
MTYERPAAVLAESQPDAVPLGGIEANGLNVISERERRGTARQLFWPWCGANVAILGLSYGSFVFGFGISFWQALIVGIAGIVLSFLLCGFIAIAGKRGSAPTLVLSRAAFGVHGNRFPAAISWLLTVGWETVMTILATLATATVLRRLGWAGGVATEVIALVIIAGLVIVGGVMGFKVVMRLQTIITVVTGALTVVFIVLAAPHVQWATVAAAKPGTAQATFGALVFVMTGFGLGWVNAAADYSRYLPRTASAKGIVFWTTFGASVAPIVLLGYGLLLAGSSEKLNGAIASDPIGALAQLLPTWFLVPFIVVAVLGLVGASVLDIYSSGLSLLAAGVRVPRFAAALIDGVIMVAGAIYVVFFAKDFVGQFQGFLTTLGVPIAAWCGVMLADIAMRRRPYDEKALFDPRGRYGSVRPIPILIVALSTAIGWGLVTNAAASWLTWQGYLLEPLGFGGKSGPWAAAGIGVLVALVLSFLATVVFGRRDVARQELGEAGAEAVGPRPATVDAAAPQVSE